MTEKEHTTRMLDQIEKIYSDLDDEKLQVPQKGKRTIDNVQKRISAVREDREVYKNKINSAMYKQKHKDFKIEY